MDDFGYMNDMSDDDDDSHPPYSSDDDIAHMDEADLFLRALLSPMGMNVTRIQFLQTKETKGPVEKLTNLGSQFPLDIIQKIMTFVEGNWLARAVRVCKAWNARLNTEEIWKEKYTREFERSGESFRYYMCHWQFQAVTKDRVSKYLSYKRAYSVVFTAKIMGKCNYCNKHPGDYYGDGIWKVCKKCSDQKLISKDDVKRKYCLSEEEMKELIFFRMPPTIVSFNECSFLHEELDIYANKLFNNDVEGELKKRRKVFTTYDVGAIERFLSKRAEFYNKLSQTLKNDTKYIPAANIPQIIQRFIYDPSVEEQSEEKVKKFVQHWDNLYHKYTAAHQAFEEAFEAAKLSPALRQEITIPIVDPINSNLQSYEHIRMDNMLLGADDKRSFQNHATRLAREHQYKAAALIEMAKQSNNKFSTLDSLYTIAKRELEETCAFRRHLAGGDNNDIFNDSAKMSVHVAATVKRVLEFNAKEEALSNHLANLGYNYKFMSMPKEVIDYVIGKSDLTFHQVVMKAIKDYTNPYADHNFIYNSMRFLSVQDKKTIACELYKKMLLPTREAAMNGSNGSEQLKKQEADDEELDQEMDSSNKKQRTPGSKRREKRPASPAQQSAAASSASAASTSNGNGAADPAIANLKIIKGRKRRLIVRNILHSLELGTLHKYILAVMNEKNNKEQAQASNHMMIE